MRRRLLALLSAVAIGAAVWFPTPSAHAAPGATVTETGWWSRNPFASPPDRGFQVATAPDGPASVSAVRVAVEGRVTKATLVINEAGGVPEAAALRVCAGASSWNATDHAWAAAPAADCAKTAPMTRNAAGGNFAADVTTLLQGVAGSTTLMIVPAAGAPAWQVDFSIAIISAEATPTPTTTTTTSTTSPPSGSPGGSGTSGSFGSGSSSSPTPPSNAFDFGSSTPAPPVETGTIGPDPSLDPDPAIEDEVGADLASGAIAVPSTATSQPWGRLVVFLPLSALAGALIAFGRRFTLDRLAG